MKSKNISITFPPDIILKLEAIPSIGYYDSTSEFIRDSIRHLLQDRKDLRIAIAFELYKQKKIDLLKATEIINDSLENVKELLKSKNI